MDSPVTYTIVGRGSFRHKGVVYGKREPAGPDVTTTAPLTKMFPDVFRVKSDVEAAAAVSAPESIGEDATEEIPADFRKLAGIDRVVKIGAAYIAMDAAGKVLATGTLAEIEKALV